jgi:hypothetical protein
LQNFWDFSKILDFENYFLESRKISGIFAKVARNFLGSVQSGV